MSREFVLSKTLKVTLHVQMFLNHWGLKRRVGAGLKYLRPKSEVCFLLLLPLLL